MGNVYLNKSVKFQCQNGNAVWFSASNGEVNVKVNGAGVLLDDCKLSLDGVPMQRQCNMFMDPTTGAPAPCAAICVSGSWNNNSGMKVGGKSVLLSNCSISCPRNGTIKPFKPTTQNINVDDAARVECVNISPAEVMQNRKESVKEKEETTENKQKETTEREGTKDRHDAVKYEYVLCDYRNCDKANECKYLKTECSLRETDERKNASELRMNMGRDAFDLYAGAYRDIATSLYGSYLYTVAHHHIIPVNQCFKEFPEIVKLANYYRYNINKAENGICLPTMNLGYDKQPFEQRKEIAFNAMEKLRRQWHKGGHEYSYKISGSVSELLPRPLKHYKSAVNDELRNLRNLLYDDMCCRANEYELQAKSFAIKMDRLCERVAKKLGYFNDNPKKAYPFYISKLAFYYAFREELKDYERELFGKEG